MKSALLLILSIAIVQYASAICNICNLENGVACISNNEFHLCENGRPNTLQTYKCRGQKICTSLAAICVEQTEDSSVTPGCGDTSNCGICTGTESDGNYACTSRTTYTMCLDGALTNVRGTCPDYQMCDISLGQTGQIPCVPNCREPNIEFCDRYEAIDQLVVTTEAPETTTELPNTTETPTTTTTTTTTNATAAASSTAEMTTTTATFAPTPPSPPNTTTSDQTTTEFPPNAQRQATALCSQQTASGRHPLPDDPTCKIYVYCFKKGGVMQGNPRKCGTNYYYNAKKKLCSLIKPEGCN